MIPTAVRLSILCSNSPIKSTIAPLMGRDGSFLSAKHTTSVDVMFNNLGLLLWEKNIYLFQTVNVELQGFKLFSVFSCSEWIDTDIHFLFLNIFYWYTWPFFLPSDKIICSESYRDKSSLFAYNPGAQISILPGGSPIFNTNSRNKLFKSNPFNLVITST